MKGLFLVGMILLSSAIIASPTHSKEVVVSDIHGNDLLRLCNSHDGTSEAEFCSGFLIGIRDGVVLATELRSVKRIFEMPLEVKQEQLKDVVVKYLKEHPEEHHKPAGMLVIFALSHAFPPQDKTVK
jgi:hypothetical protein